MNEELELTNDPKAQKQIEFYNKVTFTTNRILINVLAFQFR